jgi:hypothetical protein
VASNSSRQAIPFFVLPPWNANVPAVCDKLQVKRRYAYHVHASSVIYLGLGASWPYFALPKLYVAIKSAKSPFKLWQVFIWSVTRLRQPPPLALLPPLKSWTTSNEGMWTTWPLGALGIALHSNRRGAKRPLTSSVWRWFGLSFCTPFSALHSFARNHTTRFSMFFSS